MPFIVDKNIRDSCVDKLRSMDEKIYYSADCDWVYKPVNTHPDLQIHFVSEETAFVAPELYEYYKTILPDYLKIKSGNKSIGGTYPDNVAYNIARIGNFVILNKKYADGNIVDFYEKHGYTLINVNQGYTKCNICTDGEIAITEDSGIAKALGNNGINTLKIPVGTVSLENFQYGFIGGASGCLNGKILLSGTADEQIKDKITEFSEQNGTEICFLDKEKLTDYGSILYFE